jgi:CheY-like chemotaxis protein
VHPFSPPGQNERFETTPFGVEAVSRCKQERPDLILMDIQMPGMNGLDMIRQLRAHSEWARIPIIALTALAMPGDRERCLEAGADEYLSKPASLKTLMQIMQALLHQDAKEA